MKKQRHLLYRLVRPSLVLLILFCSCNPRAKSPLPATDGEKTKYVSIFTLDSLPRAIDLDMDISRCSYEELRLLRAYPYALHGHWFMEADINRFFDLRSEWYYQACFERYEENGYAWDSDTQAELEATPLTDVERAFIRRIDERMATLREGMFIRPANVTLLNPELVVNRFQMEGVPEELDAHLRDHNFALQSSTYEQLFQVYEDNDYKMMPSFVTSDLFLQVFHMYFSYVLKYLETFRFVPALKVMCTSLYHEAMNEYMTLVNAPRDNAGRAATFFAIALRLLDDTVVDVPQEFAQAYAAELGNIKELKDDFSVLYPSEAQFSYSLFKPRGHYTRNEQAQRYFRAMMWLQTVFFCADAVEPDSPCLYMASLLNRAGDKAQAAYHSVIRPLDFLMGEADNISVEELWSCRNASDLQGAIDKLFEKRNRISPQIANDCVKKVNLMPQRYTPDGEILGRLVDIKPNAERGPRHLLSLRHPCR